MKKRKKLLLITWRDIKSPFAGGAETLTHEILKRITNKYDVTVLTSAFPHCEPNEIIDKVNYIRLGHKKYNYIGVYNWRIYFSVFKYHFKHIYRKQHFDVIIEQINNIPFLYALYGNKNTILYINQLCRENWFYQVPKVVAWIGYFIFEPLCLFLLKNKKIITISKSTKKDLMRFGFKSKNIKIITIGINMRGISQLRLAKKYKKFSLLSLGNIREMKKTIDQFEAFSYAKRKIPELQLYIAGSPGGGYAMKLFELINMSEYRSSVHYLGGVSLKYKKEIMKKCHCILMTSTKEGWGLVVTEANSQGTPAIVYDTDGLRDSVHHMKTGLITQENTPENMASLIVKLHDNKNLYSKIRKEGWKWSQTLLIQQTVKDMHKIFASYM